jgi:hypothetical protein
VHALRRFLDRQAKVAADNRPFTLTEIAMVSFAVHATGLTQPV